ncbi:beta-lactamase domain-containing protein [Solidesulfovibrio fructosivorans JJ]]|uniref:Beta-lactamase domain-containing protein n=1 Tax=Solidesulfovibrio fructosivorans JJ] TaxID=596151 RepID=E1K036_SOLFR|nr:MBL fold metallo-hydrolase [Solidesulfovibrio fructosivorans]EFL50042.1 beta-lactamase domain-containing protein [Solidesulfovibrio fructosivorans JJ]]
MTTTSLRQTDSVSVTVLIDNSLDHFLPDTGGVAHRPILSWTDNPVAEHGLSLCVTFEGGGERHTVLLDTGLSALTLLRNMGSLGVSPDDIEAIILSHGHMDHTGGLLELLARRKAGCDLISHPGAYCRRRLNIPGKGPQPELPSLDAAALRAAGANIVTEAGPATWFSDMLLTLGEVERATDFEKGFPMAEIETDGAWGPDPFRDDQAIVLHVRDKGLVVISGCAHAGIVNTVRYARKVTGVETVHAVVGGFHLTGPAFAGVVGPTAAALRELGPRYLIPMHCTGFTATAAMAQAMPERFLISSVGTRFTFSTDEKAP